MRLRENNTGEWQSYSTAAERQPVIALPVPVNALAVADLTPTLPDNCPLQITRTWALDDGRLVLKFQITNKTNVPVEIGALGLPMIFNNFITGRSLEQAHETCSFSDPAICQDAGYLQVTRLNGHGPALVVVPEGKTPLEAYNPILGPRDGLSAATRIFADRTPRSQTFEGFYEWMPLSLAYAENEWNNAQPWRSGDSPGTLAPGATKTYGGEISGRAGNPRHRKNAGGKPSPRGRGHSRLHFADGFGRAAFLEIRAERQVGGRRTGGRHRV